ncbi:MAG: hypothetical protein ACO1QR_07150 [Chthoniobacteraceae bacterium]
MAELFLRLGRSFGISAAAFVAAYPMAMVIFAESERLIYGQCFTGPYDPREVANSPLSDFLTIVGFVYLGGIGTVSWVAAFTQKLRTRYNLAYWSALIVLAVICFSASHDFIARRQEFGGGLGAHRSHSALLLELPLALIYAWSTAAALLVIIYAVRIPFEERHVRTAPKIQTGCTELLMDRC